MSKRIITLGLLVGVLSLNSCVKDNESDAVQAQRQAQTEKLKAEASKLMAEKGLAEAQVKVQEALAKVEEANAKVAEEKAAFDKAKHDLVIAKKTKENEKDLVLAEKNLEEAKYQLEQMKQTAADELEKLKLKIIKDKDMAAQAMETYKGKKLEAVKTKYNSYIKEVEALEMAQKEVFNLETNVNVAELNAKDAKKAKEAQVERYKMLIADRKARIEDLKSVGYDLSEQVNKVQSEYSLENDIKNVKEDEYNLANAAYTNAYKTFSNKRDEDFEFYAAAGKLRNIAWDFGLPSVISGYDFSFSNELMTKEGYTVSYRVYEETLPTLNTNMFNVVVDEINKNIKSHEKSLETSKTDKTNAYDDMVAKKAAYEADKGDTNKKDEYVTALREYESATRVVEIKDSRLVRAKAQKEEFQANKKAFLKESNQKEVKAKLAELSELSMKKAEAELAKNIQTDKVSRIDDKLTSLKNILRNKSYYTVQDLVGALESDIVRFQSYIDDLSNVKTKEALAEYAKARLEEKKAEVEILKKRVEFAKKAYEDALAAL